MTYYYSSKTYEKKYEWTAFTEKDLVGSGDLGCGDVFKMPAYASVCMSTYDDDGYMSGDEYCDENASDSSGQKAYIDGAPLGAQLYAECYHVLKGSDGKTYYLIEIEVEGCAGAGDYFTFYGAVPPAGTSLKVVNTCNVSGCMVNYDCLAKCDVAPPNTPPTFSNAPENCITVDENTTFVIDLNATDADGDTLTYSLAGGADQAMFQIDASTGELTFVGAPDYEAPADADGDNTYEVMVKVSDGKGGEETKLLKVCVADVAEGGGGTCTVVEAEDMDLCGYTVENRGDASDGAGIKLCSSYGYASTTFKGDAGSYDLTLTYMDESDGNGAIAVYVNGCKVQYIALCANDNGDGGVGSSSWSTFTIEDLDLKAGDKITLVGVGNCAEYARIDKIEICQPACEPCVTIEAEDMCGYNYKTVCGAQASGGELVKLSTDWCGGINDGKLTTTFKGCDGTYDLTLWAQDENDGQSTIIVRVNGQERTIILNQDGDGAGDDNGSFTAFTLENLDINSGDEIQIWAYSDGGEYVRIDKIQLCLDQEPNLGSIGDFVWFDTDGDGIQDAGEAGAANVAVTLYAADGVSVVATTTTDSDGFYQFTDLAAGDYKVGFDLPQGAYAFTTEGAAGSTEANDSDADGAGMTGTITLAEGEDNTDVDAGLVELGSISGRVFEDTNGDNTEWLNDGTKIWEPAVAGVTVILLKDGVEVASTTTGDDGWYTFSNLVPGDYVVQFPTEIEGMTLVQQGVGDTAGVDSNEDSDADPTTGQTQVITLNSGDHVSNIDAGVRDPGTASITGTVFADENGDNQQDGGDSPIEGVTVELLDANGNVYASTTTGPDGTYTFGGLPAGTYSVRFPTTIDGKVLVTPGVGGEDVDSDANPDGTTDPVTLGIGETADLDAGVKDPGTAVITGRVFEDSDGDNQDNGEVGVGGVTVTLLNGDGSPTGRTAVTNDDGSYVFLGLAAGDYIVQFPTAVGDKVLVEANIGDDATDSDASQTTGQTGVISVGIGEVSDDNDAGLIELGSIGDTVFFDNNENGVYDTGDTLAEGVAVTLKDGNGAVVGSTATDETGQYLFTGLSAGMYQVMFGALAGYGFTTPSAAAADAANNDSDAGIGGLTDVFELGIGEDQPGIDAGLVALAEGDTGGGCADEVQTVDVLANDAFDGAGLTITEVDGQAIAEGGTVSTAAGDVTLEGGVLKVLGNANANVADLDIGEQGAFSFTYTVSDGNGGEATATVDMTYCGDANTLESLCATLPETVNFQIVDENRPAGSSDEAFTLMLSGSGDARLDGLVIEEAYCVSAYEPLVSGGAGSDPADAPLLSGTLHCTDEDLSGVLSARTIGNLDLITWILNQDFGGQGYTDAEIQGAIWGLTDNIVFVASGGGSTDNAQAIYDMATEDLDNNGVQDHEGYEAGPDGIVALVVAPDADAVDAGHEQPFIVGVAFDDLDCLC